MSRQRDSGGNGASLDSLLDTMTNVVGILVILLVVTQLSVNEAVERIGEELKKTFDPDEFARVESTAALAKKERETLEAQLAALSSANPADMAASFRKVQQQIRDEQANLQALKDNRQADQAAAMAAAQEAADAAQAKLDAQKKAEEKLAMALASQAGGTRAAVSVIGCNAGTGSCRGKGRQSSQPTSRARRCETAHLYMSRRQNCVDRLGEIPNPGNQVERCSSQYGPLR